MAVLPDGRVVSGGRDGRVLLGNLAADRADPVEIGHHNRGVWALTALPDGRVVSGGQDGRILVWNPATRDAAPPGEDALSCRCEVHRDR